MTSQICCHTNASGWSCCSWHSEGVIMLIIPPSPHLITLTSFSAHISQAGKKNEYCISTRASKKWQPIQFLPPRTMATSEQTLKVSRSIKFSINIFWDAKTYKMLVIMCMKWSVEKTKYSDCSMGREVNNRSSTGEAQLKCSKFKAFSWTRKNWGNCQRKILCTNQRSNILYQVFTIQKIKK